ncbi:hypothetical protein I7I50_10493 [Histoplasma capsulatum G186AR]|uniref:Secreted protein n=1 Tax=Ajellomyces capsulatus TaxID=5037 RepID=A0A8H7Z3V4_AJECA|nr:hypothetical protein I7I52_01732 [Histoplasma capsulatum]QSS69267.1 hypothetical protein I7I50_10493 [Histoplasma capsulatum G186AR]
MGESAYFFFFLSLFFFFFASLSGYQDRTTCQVNGFVRVDNHILPSLDENDDTTNDHTRRCCSLPGVEAEQPFVLSSMEITDGCFIPFSALYCLLRAEHSLHRMQTYMATSRRRT